MVENKALVAYEAKGGAIEEDAKRIADVLRSKYGLEVDLVDLKEQKVADLSQYENVVIGGGLKPGKEYDRALRFLENDHSGKKVAFFVTSAVAATSVGYERAKVKFTEDTLAKYPKINRVATEAFGGAIKVVGDTVADTTNLGKVEAWAEELGKKFTQ